MLRAFEYTRDLVATQVLCIVDNGSQKDQITALEKWCSAQKKDSVYLITSDSNLGFSAGMNLGIDSLKSRDHNYIWLLNNDTEVSEEAIFHLLRFSKTSSRAAIIGATIIDQTTGLIETAGGYRYFPWVGYSHPIMAGARLEDICSSEYLLPDYVNGAAVWLRGDYIRHIGGLPTDHFLYYEELELNHCLGKDDCLAWCRDAVVFHQGGGSSTTAKLQATATYHAALSAFNYTRRHKPWCLPTVIIARILGITMRSISRRQPKLLLAVFAALRDVLRPEKNWLS